MTIPFLIMACLFLTALFFTALFMLRAQKKETKRLYTILDRSQQAVMVVDHKEKVRFANQATSYFTGLSPSELLNRPLDDVLNNQKFRNLNPILQKAKNGKFKSDAYIRKEGSLVHAEVNIFPVVEGDEIKEAVVILANITDKVRGESRLKQTIQAIKNRNAELLALKEEAEAASRAKDIFLANMSHELRTPLNGVLGAVDLLSTSELTEVQSHFLAILKSSGDKLIQMISEILDLTQMETGEFSLQERPFSLPKLIEDVSKDFREEAEKKGLRFTITLEKLPDDPLLGDPNRFMQILSHLLSNAVKFTQSGEVSVSGSKVKESASDVIVAITVEDTGEGIDPRETKQIFTKFTQIDSTSTKKYAGMGHGLYFVKRLLELMRGTIYVEPRISQGSRFTFTLPFKRTTKGR